MASEPSRLAAHVMHDAAEDSDMDGEGEEDVGVADAVVTNGQAAHDSDAEGSDVDAEGEEVGDDEDAGDSVGAVKIPMGGEAPDDADEEAIVESSSNEKSSGSEDDSDGSDTDTDENEWEARSDAAEEAEAEVADPNRCVFCGDDEEHDPSEEFEEYLACAVCGDNAHRQCARNANSLRDRDDAAHWRCNTCVENGLEEDVKNATGSIARRRSSAPKIARDLLPSARGAVKPDSHSVFNTLILDDDPMDGSRSLRKRKASDEVELPSRPSRKRRRPSDAASGIEVQLDGAPRSSDTARTAMSDDVAINGTNGAASDEEGSPPIRKSRPRRSRKSDKPLIHIVDSGGISLIVSINLDPNKVLDILSKKRKKRPARDRNKKIQPPPPPEPEPSHYPAIQTSYAVPFYGLQDREQEESKLKPYGGILSEAEADTSKTFPQAVDRKRFEDARQKAEEDWRQKQAAMYSVQETGRTTHKVSGPPSKIKCISFGGYEIETWHAAPYPEEYSRNRVLYICEFCLKYMNSDYVAWRHKLKCPAKHPPGDEIYRDGRYSFFEVDGRKNPVYCQNLCLLAKLFLGSKTLYYDVEPFLFYVMTENDEFGCHFVGYFSKEKRPSSMNNVSCILVLPIHQRKGFGHMLIEFSYLLTREENRTGSPEKPLSDMGLVSYRGYWRLIMCYQLLAQKPYSKLSIPTIMQRTGMTADDIVSSLEGLRAIVRDPVSKNYALRLDYPFYRAFVANYERKRWPRIRPAALVWTPYVMGRGLHDEAPALHTVAPRETEVGGDETPEEGAQMAEQQLLEHDDDTLHNGYNDNDNTSSRDRTAAAAPTVSLTHDTRLVLTPHDECDKQLTLQHSPSRRTASPSSIHLHPEPTFTSRATLQEPQIPPTRFEIFPPLPGKPAHAAAGAASARRSRTRPFGSRRRTVTPLRRAASGKGAVGSPGVMRRGRSGLGIVEGVDGDGGKGKGKAEEDEGRAEDGSEEGAVFGARG